VNGEREGERREKTGERRQERGGRREETGERRPEREERREETGERRQRSPAYFSYQHIICFANGSNVKFNAKLHGRAFMHQIHITNCNKIRMLVIRITLMVLIVLLSFFGIRNLTALITYVHPYLSIACLIIAAFLVFVLINTRHDR
jgi:hypothetical protein